MSQISVDDELPPLQWPVITYNQDGGIFPARLTFDYQEYYQNGDVTCNYYEIETMQQAVDKGCKVFWQSYQYEYDLHYVTHWQFMPEPPIREKKSRISKENA